MPPILFTASGTFSDGSMLSGTVTIDPSSEIATEMDLFVYKSGRLLWYAQFKASPPANPPVPAIRRRSMVPRYEPKLGFPANLHSQFRPRGIRRWSPTPSPYSLSGDGTYFTLRGGEGNGNLDFGSLTPETTTPQPTSMTLLASGFLAAGGFHFVRRRRTALP